MKKDEVAGRGNTWGMINSYKCLAWNFQRKKPLGRNSQRWEHSNEKGSCRNREKYENWADSALSRIY
jgi:hypothetical protein